MRLDNNSSGVEIVINAFLKRFPCNSFEEAKEKFEAFVLAAITSEGINGAMMACDSQFLDYCDNCIKELGRRFK